MPHHTDANTTESTPNTTVTTSQNDVYFDPCQDFWAPQCIYFGLNRFTFEFGIVALLAMLHLSMVVLIVARCRYDTTFRHAFYAQFVAVTIVDCLRIVMVRALVCFLFFTLFFVERSDLVFLLVAKLLRTILCLAT